MSKRELMTQQDWYHHTSDEQTREPKLYHHLPRDQYLHDKSEHANHHLHPTAASANILDWGNTTLDGRLNVN